MKHLLDTVRTLPDARDMLSALREGRSRTGRLLVGLDFDGTLAEIVLQPADARLVHGALPVLQRLAARTDTTVAIVTGRGVADARMRVAMPDLHYAGNHGLEIEGPGILWIHPDATSARPALDQLLRELRQSFAGRGDITLEDKAVSFSVHFRSVEDDAEQAAIARVVHNAAAGLPDAKALRLMGGRRVVEVRPAADWDKGRALHSLRETLEFDDAPAIFIGDDVTDEDAFRVLRGPDDLAIVVGEERVPETEAGAMLPSIRDVISFLEALAL